MIDRILGWLRRRSENSQVTYSRFGLPGDEVDERAPPTHIHVAHFDDDARQYRAFFTHSTRAAAIAAGFGLACYLFALLVFLCQVRWQDFNLAIYIYRKFLIIVTMLVIAIAIHCQVLVGIKQGKAMHLGPAVTVYSFLLVVEGIFLCFVLIWNPWSKHGRASTVFCLTVTGVHGAMLISFCRARSYYEHRETHRMEVRVAERGKRENPQMQIVYVKATDRVDPKPVSDVPIVTSSPRLRVVLSANDVIS